MRFRIVVLAVAIAAVSSLARWQLASAQSPAAPVTFSVASVKPNKSGERAANIDDEKPGAFAATNVWLRLLITYAYEIKGNQLESAPDWTRAERFDIAARLDPAPAGTSASESQRMRLALRTLLAERFNLAVRRETRDVPMWALVLARADGRLGPLLKRSSGDCSPEGLKTREAAGQSGAPLSGVCGLQVNTGRLRFGGYPMSEFARRFSPSGRSVIDRTGLTGNWEFELTYTPDQPAPGRDTSVTSVNDPNAPHALPTALVEQLGLTLEPTNGSVDVLVVQRVERPTEN